MAMRHRRAPAGVRGSSRRLARRTSPLTAGSDANRDRDDAERAGVRHEPRHLAAEPAPALELLRSEKERFGVIVNGLGRRPIDSYRKKGLLHGACGDRSTTARETVGALSVRNRQLRFWAVSGSALVVRRLLGSRATR